MTFSERFPISLRHSGGGLAWMAVLAFGLSAAAQDTPAKTEAKPPIDPTHPLYRPLELAYKSREALKDLKDYKAVFNKQEANERDRRPKASAMEITFREEPFSVYLKFQNPNAGREVIYVQGKNNNQLLVHDTGVKAIAGTVSLDPKGTLAMEDSRYPVTMIGMKNMLEKIIAQWEKEGKFAETTVKYYPEAKLGDVPCMVIETSHPEKRDEFKFQMTRLFIDTKTNYPIRVEQYGFPDRRAGGKKDKKDGPPLVEEYTYSNIQANLGLKDKDFDHTNPSYAFPK